MTRRLYEVSAARWGRYCRTGGVVVGLDAAHAIPVRVERRPWAQPTCGVHRDEAWWRGWRVAWLWWVQTVAEFAAQRARRPSSDAMSPFGNDPVRRARFPHRRCSNLSRPSIVAVHTTSVGYGPVDAIGVDIDYDLDRFNIEIVASAGLCAAAMALGPEAAAAPLIEGGYACIASSAGAAAAPVVAAAAPVAAGGAAAADVCSPASAPVADMAGVPFALPGPLPAGAPVGAPVPVSGGCAGGCAGSGGCAGGCAGAGGSSGAGGCAGAGGCSGGCSTD